MQKENVDLKRTYVMGHALSLIISILLFAQGRRLFANNSSRGITVISNAVIHSLYIFKYQ